MRKYRLHDYKHEICGDWWHLLPTIEIYGKDYRFYEQNFTVAVHFLCFHARWRFMAGGKK